MKKLLKNGGYVRRSNLIFLKSWLSTLKSVPHLGDERSYFKLGATTDIRMRIKHYPQQGSAGPTGASNEYRAGGRNHNLDNSTGLSVVENNGVVLIYWVAPSKKQEMRVVAQFGSVHRSGRWGRWFESSQPDIFFRVNSIEPGYCFESPYSSTSSSSPSIAFLKDL